MNLGFYKITGRGGKLALDGSQKLLPQQCCKPDLPSVRAGLRGKRGSQEQPVSTADFRITVQ